MGFACGVRTTGAAVCWGQDPGRAGVLEVPSGGFAQISAGNFFVCGVRPDGTAVCWGDDTYAESDVPAAPYAQVAALGLLDDCALRVDHSWTCWGDYFNAGGNEAVFKFKRLLPARLREIAGGPPGGFCALRMNWTVACPALGSGATPPPAGTFSQVSPADGAGCGIRRSSATVACWDIAGSALLHPPKGRFLQVATGAGGEALESQTTFACAIRANRTLACWGYHALRPPGGRFDQISGGYYSVCGVRTTGIVKCWAEGPYSMEWTSRSVRRSLLLQGHFLQVSDSGNGLCGLRTDHTIVCAGEQSTSPWLGHKYNQVSVGYGDMDPDNYLPGDVCAIDLTGEVHCWGDLSFIAPSATPMAVTHTAGVGGASNPPPRRLTSGPIKIVPS